MPTYINRTTHRVRRSVSPAALPDIADELEIIPGSANESALAALQSVAPEWWRIDGQTLREATAQEKLADIANHRLRKLKQLIAAVNEYGAAHYDSDSESRLGIAYAEARYDEGQAPGTRTNRIAYLQLAMSWRDALRAEYVARATAALAAATIEQVDAVSLDFSAFDATDPAVTLTQALGILD